MVKVLLCGVFILLAAILLSIGGTMLQHLFCKKKMRPENYRDGQRLSGGTTAQNETLLSGL